MTVQNQENYKEIVQTLRDHGFQVTSQRVIIYDYLKHTKDHPSAEQIFENIFKSLPGISKATVYNTLEAFSSHGLIQKINSLGGVAHYDGNMDAHAHLICTRCQRIIDFYKNPLDGFKIPETTWPGFGVDRTCVIFYGICEDCRNALNNPEQTGECRVFALKEAKEA